jgi:hypothetical protein
VVPARLAAPATKPDIHAHLPAAVSGEEGLAQVEEAALVQEEAENLPVGLPRAEDFDFGDPDILSGTEREGTQLLVSGGSPARRLLGRLSWKKRE